MYNCVLGRSRGNDGFCGFETQHEMTVAFQQSRTIPTWTPTDSPLAGAGKHKASIKLTAVRGLTRTRSIGRGR